jgi:ankyrin repeat protein
MQARERSASPANAAAAPAEDAARADALRHNFLSCLILSAQNGFGQDVEPFLALSWETWGEEQLWAAVKDLPHGRVRQEGPARQFYRTFGCELGPFSAGRTHVMYAAQAGLAARLQWLIARGARLELKDWMGRTALFWASQEGRMEAARELLARGAAVDTADLFGRAPLCIASKKGHLEVVRELLVQGAAVDIADNNGWTPLLIASSVGHLEVVRELLARGAAVDTANLKHGWTPLRVASWKGHLEVVRELLARGASPGLAANDGSTALSHASTNGHAAIAQLLRAALAAA